MSFIYYHIITDFQGYSLNSCWIMYLLNIRKGDIKSKFKSTLQEQNVPKDLLRVSLRKPAFINNSFLLNTSYVM